MKIAESKRTKIRDLEDGDSEKFSQLYEDLKSLSLTKETVNRQNISAERVLDIFSAANAVYTIETNDRKSRFLGFIFLSNFEEFKLKNQAKPLHINCIILPSFRGKGFGQESIYAFMDYYLKKDPNAMFVSKARLSNVASIRIMNRYMQSIPYPNKKEHDFVYFVTTADIFSLKTQQQ